MIINETGKCVDSCTESPLYKYEYNDFCFENCSNGYYIKEDKYKCKCELEKCFTCSDESLKQNLCTKRNTNYYQKDDDDLFNIFGFIDCYKDTKGHYLDKNESLYKKCCYRCETCEISGDNKTHNCLECISNFPNVINNDNNYSNCYENCSYYYYFDSQNIYHCTLNSYCPDNYPILKEGTNECIKEFPSSEIEKILTSIATPITTINISPTKTPSSEIENIHTSIAIPITTINKPPIKTTIITTIITTILTKNIMSTIPIEAQKFDKNEEMKNKIDNILNKEKNLTNINEKDEEIKYYDDILKIIEEGFTSEDYDTSNLDKGENEIIETDKMTITFTTTENQKNNDINNNMTTIDLGECERSLRKYYNISENEILYIKKLI